MKKHLALFFVLTGLVWLGLILAKKYNEPVPLEAFSNYNQGTGADLLVADTYPPKQPVELNNKDASNLWSYYPIFQLGSYEQITNNMKHVRNPDVGRCMPSSMCGAMYHDNEQGTNVVTPLPPVVTPEGQTRVGYFNSVGSGVWNDQ